MSIPFPSEVFDRVMEKVTPGPNGCWISTYSRGSHGYAQVGWGRGTGGTVTLAHRVAWMGHNRDVIPPGWTVDHICRVRPCVRPSHLRLLSNLDNARDNGQDRRGVPTPTGRECRRGHALLLYPTGATNCMECVRENGRRKEQKQRQQRAA